MLAPTQAGPEVVFHSNKLLLSWADLSAQAQTAPHLRLKGPQRQLLGLHTALTTTQSSLLGKLLTCRSFQSKALGQEPRLAPERKDRKTTPQPSNSN